MPDPGSLALAAPLVSALLGALLSVLLRHEPDRSLAWGYGAAALTGLLAVIAGARVLAGAASPRLLLFAVLPGDDLALHLTPLSAFFWLLCGTATAAVGMASAFGMYMLAVLTGLLLFATLALHHLPGWKQLGGKHGQQDRFH